MPKDGDQRSLESQEDCLHIHTLELRNTVTGAISSSLVSPFIESSGLHQARFDIALVL
jgi:hypothetical protein